MIRLILLVAMLMLQKDVFSQITIRGHIRNAKNRQGILNAKISATGRELNTTLSDQEGYFEMILRASMIVGKSYYLRVSASGYNQWNTLEVVTEKPLEIFLKSNIPVKGYRPRRTKQNSLNAADKKQVKPTKAISVEITSKTGKGNDQNNDDVVLTRSDYDRILLLSSEESNEENVAGTINAHSIMSYKLGGTIPPKARGYVFNIYVSPIKVQIHDLMNDSSKFFKIDSYKGTYKGYKYCFVTKDKVAILVDSLWKKIIFLNENFANIYQYDNP